MKAGVVKVIIKRRKKYEGRLAKLVRHRRPDNLLCMSSVTADDWIMRLSVDRWCGGSARYIGNQEITMEWRKTFFKHTEK